MAYAIGQCIIDNSENEYGTLPESENDLAEYVNNATELIENTEFIPVTNLTKLGIQASAGSFFVLNGEIIEVGRTSTYELIFNSVTVTSLKVLSPQIFIIDYKYSL